MATRSISLQVPSAPDMETMTMSYIAQGFNVANKTPMQVTLIKRKQFSVLWAVIGFIVCVLPLLIYLIIYASESDQMVTITVAGIQAMPYSGQLAPPQSTSPYSRPLAGSQPLAPSGAFGAAPASRYLNAPRSPDGYYWWDGQAWQLIPQAGQTGPMRQPPTDLAWPPPVDPIGY